MEWTRKSHGQNDGLRDELTDKGHSYYPQGLRVCNRNLIFLFLKQNICCGYLKEHSQ